MIRTACGSLHLVGVRGFGGIVASLSRRRPQTHFQRLSLPGDKSRAVPRLALLLRGPAKACIFKAFYRFRKDGIRGSRLAEVGGRRRGVGLGRRAAAIVCRRLGGGGVRQDVSGNNWSGKNNLTAPQQITRPEATRDEALTSRRSVVVVCSLTAERTETGHDDQTQRDQDDLRTQNMKPQQH